MVVREIWRGPILLSRPPADRRASGRPGLALVPRQEPLVRSYCIGSSSARTPLMAEDFAGRIVEAADRTLKGSKRRSPATGELQIADGIQPQRPDDPNSFGAPQTP